MSIAAISPLTSQLVEVSKGGPRRTVPLSLLLSLNQLLKKSIFSRKFYQEINDKVLAKSSTVDTNLYFICYFTLLVSAILNNKSHIKHFLQTQKYNLIQVVKKVLQNTLGERASDLTNTNNKFVNKLFSTPKPVYTEGKPSKLAVHFKAISSYLADIRIFNRLTESIKYMPWIIDEYRAYADPSNPVPKFTRFVNLLQSLNCLALELLENAGWITDHNWVGTGDNAWWCTETYIWCSRIWGAYLVIEILELVRRNPVAKWDSNWKIAMFKQLIQVPLVLHWSLYDGCLTPFWVGVCGCGASWWGFKDMWSSIDLS
ncbi:hypothetical protein PICST_86597 [Scheffersomyces stipitis CBS 6054]|uniref:Uncharacterized protein n=1 Tax=Scheffersomyces stipitis (strain ATCC 58785 / CBS 6054 / NBRC 10063 / NRRL Y-11545) TaxID=322104 RepID=A3GF18_PICST|nr:predicted protein [Scheffersomyces stipitis CBS 6054]EAZ63680.1 hypothetical protein PICST_86597 [Scheffersomyces stipitis CBS 6054]KAG2731649.1 hypothetical protein G9P44_005236 [Scheffersomyces stipitis]